jgi:toxin YoeB
MTAERQRPAESKKARRIEIVPHCMQDIRWWVDTNRKTALKVLDLIETVMRDPFSGIGKPEHLKEIGANIWSRRITGEHRLVYLVLDDRISFLQARMHY